MNKIRDEQERESKKLIQVPIHLGVGMGQIDAEDGCHGHCLLMKGTIGSHIQLWQDNNERYARGQSLSPPFPESDYRWHLAGN